MGSSINLQPSNDDEEEEEEEEDCKTAAATQKVGDYE